MQDCRTPLILQWQDLEIAGCGDCKTWRLETRNPEIAMLPFGDPAIPNL
jgi:hypothetical protein